MKTFRYIFILLFVFISLICNAENTFPTNYRDHNKVNTCKNLLQKYTLDELSMMISTGNFDDIYVGDYIEMEMTSDYGTEKVRWLVGAINYFKHRTNVDLTDNHIVLVAEDCFVNQNIMNSTAITTGGFASSSMYMSILPKYDTAIENTFGSNHVLSYYQLLTTSTNTTAPAMKGNNTVGCSNNWVWANGNTGYPHVTKLCLMNEVQLLGTLSISSSFYDIGINNSQFPLFAQMPEKISCGRGFNASTATRMGYWLTNITGNTSFGTCSNVAHISSNSSNVNSGIRPYFLFK